MKKYLLILPVLAVLLLPYFTRAATIAELQALIKQLQAQIQSLQAQIADQSQGQAQWCHDFNVNLKFGDRGDEVGYLQAALEKEGFTISENEASRSYFGESTASAVSGFQEKYKDEVLTPLGLKYATGFVGSATRKKLNSLYGCGKIVVQPPTTPLSLSSSPEPEQSTTNPSITVLSPNGGEVWQIGKTYLIRWSSQGLPPDLLLEIDLLQPIPGSIPEQWSVVYTVAPAVKNTGEFSWTIPLTINLGEATQTITPGQYWIGINTGPRVASGKYVGIGDKSDAPFSIVTATTNPSITLLSPAGGEQWQTGKSYQVRWNGGGSYVSLALISQSAESLGSSVSKVWSVENIVNTGSYDFTVPTSLASGNYRFYISDKSNYAYSNYFSIVSASDQPILSMALDSSSPSGYVVAGSVNVPLFAVRFKTGSSEVRFNLTVSDVGSSAGSGNLSNVRLYDGATLFANGYRESGGAYDSYTFNNTIILAANTIKTFVVKADIASNATGSVKLRVSGISHNYGTSLNLQGEAEGYSLSIISSRGAAPAPNYLASIQAQLNAITLELQKILEKLR